MAKKSVDLKTWLVPRLRRLSMYWPEKSIARERARVEVQIGEFQNGKAKFKIMYECAICHELVDKKEGQMDHIIPAEDPNRYVPIEEFVLRLFSNANNYQHLCKPCHFIKTQSENITRQENKQKSKKKP